MDPDLTPQILVEIQKLRRHNQIALAASVMHSLTVELSAAEIDNTSEISDYVFSWADFCRLAYSAYEKNKKKT